MKFKVEVFVEADEFDIPENKSKSMINALQREQIASTVFEMLCKQPMGMFNKIHVASVRKVQNNEGN